MTVDPTYAAWLKDTARYVTWAPGSATAWGTAAVESTILSPLALQADALIEASRQANFLAGPIAKDTVIVKGQRRDLIGRVITVQGDRLGYEGAGAAVFVCGAAEADTGGVTTLTVLKRLAA